MIEIRCGANWESLINQNQLEEVLKVFLKNLFINERGLSLYLTDDKEIQKLNLKFRGIDSPTDILSWSYADDERDSDLSQVQYTNEMELAGDLVVWNKEEMDCSAAVKGNGVHGTFVRRLEQMATRLCFEIGRAHV